MRETARGMPKVRRKMIKFHQWSAMYAWIMRVIAKMREVCEKYAKNVKFHENNGKMDK